MSSKHKIPTLAPFSILSYAESQVQLMCIWLIRFRS